jgi:REP-associated tyrosine transposase
MSTGINKLFHCRYSLSYRFVFVTKYRRKCFDAAMLERLKAVVQALCQDWDAELIEVNGEDDHVHLLLGLNPKCAPSIVANNFKTVTSRLLRKQFHHPKPDGFAYGALRARPAMDRALRRVSVAPGRSHCALSP